MRKYSIFLLLIALLPVAMSAQQCYWVFFADKAGTTFDPYAYFDAKAVERYHQCGADLADVTNYPVNEAYVAAVDALAADSIGSSRWLNAHAVEATAAQAEAIAQLPFVARVLPIEGDMQLAGAPTTAPAPAAASGTRELTDQLVRMGGQAFRDAGIDGHGVRIAVFDGGFPRVNTHAAFRHLRDEGRILATWNFPNRKADVYGWNSHGTMTLSCIAGRNGDRDLGLATGAEFLLARTEVGLEPAKEEVWWQMAVEWADRHGANIISSSLGYGKERHYTRDMDGTSLVARAANLAARKGMLVVNSAGNEADVREWRTIITPADADSVLCIGGIEHSLDDYNHISFSSYGPSADGRQKPNVCAFGHAQTADDASDLAYHMVDGTSFSCPLVAGFVACAWQATPGVSNMQLFRMIEQSADLYPYCDYAYGYGVPQASFFVGQRKPVAPTFAFTVDGSTVSVRPLHTLDRTPIFYKETLPSGRIVRYGKKTLTVMDSLSSLDFTPVEGNTLVVSVGGYTDSIVAPGGNGYSWAYLSVPKGSVRGEQVSSEYGDASKPRVSQWGDNAKYRYDIFLQYGVTPNTASSELTVGYSDAFRVGGRLLRGFSKCYALGIGLDFGRSNYNFSTSCTNQLDDLLFGAGNLSLADLETKQVELDEWSLELFQRVRFVAGSMLSGRGLYFDLGVYCSKANNRYKLYYDHDPSTDLYRHEELTLRYVRPLSQSIFNYGVTARLGFGIVALYGRYRLTGLFSDDNPTQVTLPRLEVGLQLAF